LPSPRPSAASWHDAHESWPLAEKRFSKNKRCPRSAARSSSATALVSFAGGAGSGVCVRSFASSLPLHCGACDSASAISQAFIPASR
jgi:hypothetical protein